ncbi:MAG: response regulator [Gammaproteobacteria bacterium]|nr:response regulator [Gammaproteobacteria bacterium]
MQDYRLDGLARRVTERRAATSSEGADVDTALTVLVVDDDPDVRELLQDYLTDSGYEVLLAEGARTARALLAERTPDLCLLDISLPGEDGLSLARFLREEYDLAIIMVSGAGETLDRIVGLEVGADDYLSKPFDLRELRARIKSVARRYQRGAKMEVAPPTETTRRVPFGAVLLDLDSRQMFAADGAELPLTAAEFDLLKALHERPNRPLSRDQLMNLTRNRDWDPFDRSIDIRIARLRRKVEADPDRPQAIRTVRGVGYMFVPGGRA